MACQWQAAIYQYKIQSRPACYGAAVTFGEKVLVTMVNWKGQYEAATYEFIETPEETGLGDIE